MSKRASEGGREGGREGRKDLPSYFATMVADSKHNALFVICKQINSWYGEG